jgi:hypothetical protein
MQLDMVDFSFVSYLLWVNIDVIMYNCMLINELKNDSDACFAIKSLHIKMVFDVTS